MHRRFPPLLGSVVLVVVLLAAAERRHVVVEPHPPPYLTDLVQRHVTDNWATTSAVTRGQVAYGQAGVEACDAHRAKATAVPITVGAVAETQWSANLNKLSHDTPYCYSV